MCVVFGLEGWPNGMAVGWSGRFSCLVHSRTHPVRGAGLGRKGRCGRVSQAVRPAGKRLRDADDAKVFVDDDQYVTNEPAPGIAAEMDGKVGV